MNVYPSAQSCLFLNLIFFILFILLQFKDRQYVSNQCFIQEKLFPFTTNVTLCISNSVLCKHPVFSLILKKLGENSFADLGGVLNSAIVVDKTWQK